MSYTLKYDQMSDVVLYNTSFCQLQALISEFSHCQKWILWGLSHPFKHSFFTFPMTSIALETVENLFNISSTLKLPSFDFVTSLPYWCILSAAVLFKSWWWWWWWWWWWGWDSTKYTSCHVTTNYLFSGFLSSHCKFQRAALITRYIHLIEHCFYISYHCHRFFCKW